MCMNLIWLICWMSFSLLFGLCVCVHIFRVSFNLIVCVLMHSSRSPNSWLWIEEMSLETGLMKSDQVSRAAIQHIKLHFRQHFETFFQTKMRETNTKCWIQFISVWQQSSEETYRRRLPKNDDWLSDDGGGGGIQLASLINASSRRLAAIVENFARVSGVILFMVEKARAACSSAGFL